MISDGWMGGWMDGCLDGWMDVWIWFMMFYECKMMYINERMWFGLWMIKCKWMCTPNWWNTVDFKARGTFPWNASRLRSWLLSRPCCLSATEGVGSSPTSSALL
jgi:hypothetical protein